MKALEALEKLDALGKLDALEPPRGGELHLHLLREADVPTGERARAELEAAWLDLLDEEERERVARMRLPHVRYEQLATRALARGVLSRYAPEVPARAWRFERTERGRPFVKGPAPLAVDFNLSNTRGLVACLVGPSAHAVGVDVEWTARGGETLSVADRYFSRAEVDALFALPPKQRDARFFALWTLKEAYIKARGLGLAIPLGQFSFSLEGDEAGETIGVHFDERLDDDPKAWRFARFRAGDGHVGAFAVKLTREATREVAQPAVRVFHVGDLSRRA